MQTNQNPMQHLCSEKCNPIDGHIDREPMQKEITTCDKKCADKVGLKNSTHFHYRTHYKYNCEEHGGSHLPCPCHQPPQPSQESCIKCQSKVHAISCHHKSESHICNEKCFLQKTCGCYCHTGLISKNHNPDNCFMCHHSPQPTQESWYCWKCQSFECKDNYHYKVFRFISVSKLSQSKQETLGEIVEMVKEMDLDHPKDCSMGECLKHKVLSDLINKLKNIK